MVTKAIIGLGNPTLIQCKQLGFELHELFQAEQKCPSTTRHNAGFAALNALAPDAFSYDKGLNANLATVRIGKEDVLLVQPLTWMNDSGVTVRTLLPVSFFRVEDLLIVYDDKDLPLGELRFGDDGGAGGHNGIKSIIANLGTTKFNRLKFGVGPVPPEIKIIKFVLEPIKPEVQSDFDKMAKHAAEAVHLWVKEGTAKSGMQYNRRNLLPAKTDSPST